MKSECLALDDIFLEDERFRISYHFSLDNLVLSLERVGLVNPPLIVFRDNHFILVSGWKRILACQKLSLSPIPVHVIEEEDDLKTFLIAFYENLATREFSFLEKAEILSRLKNFGEEKKKIVQYYLPLLHIPPTLSCLGFFLDLSRFKPEVKRLIYEKNMPFTSIQLLAEFTYQERGLLLPLLLPLGQNKQKEILEDLQEISKRNDTPAKKILNLKEMQEILDSERFSSLQKADKIRLLLKKKRYPTVTSWKESFDSLLKKLDCPKEIMVRPSPFFEEENFYVSFSFKNREEFKGHLLKLQELASKEEFPRMFELK